MFQTKVVEENKVYIYCLITVSENLAVYAIKGKNVVEPERPQMAM
jgi:hypothetical protein